AGRAAAGKDETAGGSPFTPVTENSEVVVWGFGFGIGFVPARWVSARSAVSGDGRGEVEEAGEVVAVLEWVPVLGTARGRAAWLCGTPGRLGPRGHRRHEALRVG